METYYIRIQVNGKSSVEPRVFDFQVLVSKSQAIELQYKLSDLTETICDINNDNHYNKYKHYDDPNEVYFEFDTFGILNTLSQLKECFSDFTGVCRAKGTNDKNCATSYRFPNKFVYGTFDDLLDKTEQANSLQRQNPNATFIENVLWLLQGTQSITLVKERKKRK